MSIGALGFYVFREGSNKKSLQIIEGFLTKLTKV